MSGTDLRTGFSLYLISLLFSFSADANENVWAINVTGGASVDNTSEDFYTSSKEMHQSYEQLGVPRKQILNFFGPKRGPRCYTRSTDLFNKDFNSAIAAFKRNPNDCKLAGEVFKYEENEEPYTKPPYKEIVCDGGKKEVILPLGELGGVPGRNDFAGRATKKDFMNSLDRVIKRAKKRKSSQPLHLQLNLVDHGFKANDTWLVYLGDLKDYITVDDLKPYLSRLKKAGVNVHLHVSACFSGGFNSLTDVTSSLGNEGMVCSSADTDPDTAAAGSGDGIKYVFSASYFKRLGTDQSALRSFACSLARDSWNRPQSSMDVIVSEWEKNHKKQLGTSCLPNVGITETSAQIQKLSDSLYSGDQLRRDLLQAYQQHFVSVVEACHEDRKSEVAYSDQLAQCVKHPDAKVPESTQAWLYDAYVYPRAESYDVDTMQRHLRFLKTADSNSLLMFKRAFCCMSYNLKTGKNLPLCGQ